jgi:tripartite ATP-independent transporter DctM subunit
MLIFIVMIILIFAGAPIAFAMLTACLVQLLSEGGQFLTTIPLVMSASLNSFPLLAVPFFILAAEIMNSAKITERVFLFCRHLIGHVSGGLGLVNVIASMIFAGMSGSGVADASGLGKVEVKAMLEEGYDRPFAAAITAASSTIGPIIPPSIGCVILAYISGTSVGQLLLAGIVPGFTLGLGLMIVVYFLSRKRHYPKFKRATWTELRGGFKDAILALITPLILVIGILSGAFTPTEAAVVCVAYSAFLGIVVYRTLGFKDIYAVLAKSSLDTAIILFLASAAQVVGALLVRAQFPQKLVAFVLEVSQNPSLIIILIFILVLVLGCIMDDLSILLIMGPILVPLAVKIGYDPVHFGILLIASLCLGMITPPIGLGMYITCYITETKMEEFAREIVPFFVMMVSVILLLFFLPDVVLFIPRLILPGAM